MFRATFSPAATKAASTRSTTAAEATVGAPVLASASAMAQSMERRAITRRLELADTVFRHAHDGIFVTDRDQRILLPAVQPVAALERVIAMHQAQGLLDRDVTVVDLRNPARPTLRLSQSAMNILRNTQGAAPLAPAADIGTGDE